MSANHGGAKPTASQDAVATKECCEHCFDVLLNAFTGELVEEPRFPQAFCPLFVSWDKKVPVNGTGKELPPRLRGCVGSLEARWLHSGIKDFALRSAFKDTRFHPISEEEVPFLVCSVYLLRHFEAAKGIDDWEIGVHGLIVKFLDPIGNCYRSATFLPYVAEDNKWSHLETIDELIRKSGYNGFISDELRASLEMTRYESSQFSYSYDEYIQSRNHQTSMSKEIS